MSIPESKPKKSNINDLVRYSIFYENYINDKPRIFNCKVSDDLNHQLEILIKDHSTTYPHDKLNIVEPEESDDRSAFIYAYSIKGTVIRVRQSSNETNPLLNLYGL